MKANNRKEDSWYESYEQHSSSQNLDLNNIMKANKRTDDSCNESDEQHSSSQNLDLKRNIYQRELERKEYKFLQ